MILAKKTKTKTKHLGLGAQLRGKACAYHRKPEAQSPGPPSKKKITAFFGYKKVCLFIAKNVEETEKFKENQNYLNSYLLYITMSFILVNIFLYIKES